MGVVNGRGWTSWGRRGRDGGDSGAKDRGIEDLEGYFLVWDEGRRRPWAAKGGVGGDVEGVELVLSCLGEDYVEDGGVDLDRGQREILVVEHGVGKGRGPRR